MITEQAYKELEKKLKEKTTQRELAKKYKKKKFEYKHPLLFKIKDFFDRNKI